MADPKTIHQFPAGMGSSFSTLPGSTKYVLIGMVARWDDARPTDADLEAKEESIYGELGER